MKESIQHKLEAVRDRHEELEGLLAEAENDPAESRALRALFGGRAEEVPISATKKASQPSGLLHNGRSRLVVAV